MTEVIQLAGGQKASEKQNSDLAQVSADSQDICSFQ